MNFFNNQNTAKEYFNESSLSRLYSKMENSDTGCITAYRSQEMDENGNVIKTYTKKENQERNKILLAKLMKKGYGVTSVKGSYIENYGTPQAKEVGEHTYFVEDMRNTGNLKKDLIELGELFNQDSILFIPKGSFKGILIGTNQASFPGYKNEINTGGMVMGTKGEFMTKVKNRPFIFESVIKEETLPQGTYGRMALNAYSNRKVL